MACEDRYYHERPKSPFQFYVVLEMGCFKKDRTQDGGRLYPEGSGSGRSHVVLFSTWSTKYSLPFRSTRCSHLEHQPIRSAQTHQHDHDNQSDQPRPNLITTITNQISP